MGLEGGAVMFEADGGGVASSPAEAPRSQETGERSWEPRRRARSAGDLARTSYYEQPVIHRPHWKWLVITYFFLGGIAGGSYVIASIADLVSSGGDRRISRAGRFVSLAALLPCPILLILDLGRPERFLNMLRVLKLRSPMSVGSWGLSVFGGFCTLSALGEAGRAGVLDERTALGRLSRILPTRALGLVGILPAFFVSGYTGVLLAATAVPLWTRNYLLMGPLFLASSLASAAAAITLVLAVVRGTSQQTLGSLERLSAIAHVAELALLTAMHLNTSPQLATPLRSGPLARLFRAGVLGAGLLAPLALESRGVLRRSPPSRVDAALVSILTIFGGYLLRYVMVMAGRASADDPHATFELTGREAARDTIGIV
jgi:formate-dependent nitrite reductase membrane component NrfD